MAQSGCTRSRALMQQAAADLLQRLATRLLQVAFKDGRRCVITGDFADGWCVGYEAADIDWTVISDGREYHLQSSCKCNGTDGYLPVIHGDVQVGPLLGTQTSVTAPASGVRPRQTTRYAVRCCSSLNEARNRTLQDFSGETVHLVQTDRTDEMQVSFSLQEKQLLRGLSTVQGQLLALLRFLFKRHMTETGGVSGLTTEHANTLLLFALASHGPKNDKIWQPSNLTQLLEESLDRMLAFLDFKDSSDVCMPHFFMPDALLYIKDVNTCVDLPDTKEAIGTQLTTLRADAENLANDFEDNLRPIESDKLIFHPFTLLPLIPLPQAPLSLPHDSSTETAMLSIYSLVHECLQCLMQPSEAIMSLPYESNWCQSAVICLKAMQHLKLERRDDAVRLLHQLTSHRVQRAWKEADLRPFIKRYANYTDFVWEWPLSNSFDWAWRFCFPCQTRPSLPFLPAFTQTLFTARLSQLRSSHIYVNFRCVTWSLQAELLDHRPTGTWLEELRLGNPDFEELLTLAQYSDRREELEFCVEQMEEVRDKGRFAMDTVDQERLDWVKKKLIA